MELGRKEPEGGGEAGNGLSIPWKQLGHGSDLAMGDRAMGQVPWGLLWGHPGAWHPSVLPKSRCVLRLGAGQRCREWGCHGTAWPQPRKAEGSL